MAQVVYTVVKGDTLSHIAKRYGTTYQYLAKINNIPNPNLIYVGQKIVISGASSSSSPSPSPSPSYSPSYSSTQPTQATITAFGLQADTDRTVFATWSWSRSNTDKYQVYWSYMTESGIWFTGSDSTTNNTDSVYNAPANAKQVRFKVKPISQTYTSNNTSVSYWTASWSSVQQYSFSSNPPSKPSAPTVSIEDYTLTARLDNVDIGATYVQFQVIKNNASEYKVGNAKIITSTAIFSCPVNAGDTYKVRCRGMKDDGVFGPWSDYSGEVSTKPNAPSAITSYSATSSTSVRLTWMSVSSADTYDIQYATKREYLDGSNAVTTLNNIESAQYEITGLTMGSQYFFRVRAVNDKGTSDWTDVVSVVVGTTPIAPTTWSSTTTAMIGENVILFWVHNSEDGSKQKYAEVELWIGDTQYVYTVRNEGVDDDGFDRTLSYTVNTTGFQNDTELRWRVRTAGITNTYGEWSVERTVKVYAPVTLQLNLTNNDDENISIVESFPFYIKAIAGPSSQTPISYHVTIKAKEYYQTTDEVGNIKHVAAGDEVFSKHYDTDQELLLEMLPSILDLENNIAYTIICTVSMNTGLSEETELEFTVSWIDAIYTPNAEIAYDPDTVTTNIRPYCDYYPIVYYQVIQSEGSYIKTSTVIDEVEGISVDNALTTTGEIVYSADGTLFCMVISDDEVLVDDVTLSVYRREFDGTFVELGKGLGNGTTFVTDPHPALDYARYRIVAISNVTGAIGYTDMPAYPIQEKSVIIQWDEAWTSYEEINADEFETSVWAGTMLRLPYNIDVSDSTTPDVTLVKYIGRTHPISYYGTQLGSSATWNVEIDKKDAATLHALRKLANWMGDVYVREPSGSGYWANVTVSFNQKHKTLVIPVTLNINRVIGGV